MRSANLFCISAYLFVQFFQLSLTSDAIDSSTHHIVSFVGQQSKKKTAQSPMNATSMFGKLPEHTDNVLKKQLNTLENTNLKQMKRSIPALEPVRHLLNHARDGGLNHTLPGQSGNKEVRHQLFASNHQTNNESSAIETEEDRESANDSTEFQFLDTIGRIGSKLFEFLGNLQRFFAASSGSTSAGLSTSTQ